jgi:hypothetical protein
VRACGRSCYQAEAAVRQGLPPRRSNHAIAEATSSEPWPPPPPQRCCRKLAHSAIMRGVGRDLAQTVGMSASMPIAASLLTTALPAFFGFAGVVAGALLTPWMNRRLDDRRDLEQAKTAWILLREDAASASRAVRERQNKGKWPIAWNRDWSSVWRASRGWLARRVTSRERFRCVAEAFERMDELESAVNTPRAEQDRILSDKDREFLAGLLAVLSKAELALAAELDDPDFSSASRVDARDDQVDSTLSRS